MRESFKVAGAAGGPAPVDVIRGGRGEGEGPPGSGIAICGPVVRTLSPASCLAPQTHPADRQDAADLS